MMRRRFLHNLGACVVVLLLGRPRRPRRPTVRQLVEAARQWLKRHHVKRWKTVTIIPGDGPPDSGLLSPIEAGGWRWAPNLYSWVSPAFQVSWSAGDVIGSFESPFAGQHVQLYVGDWTVGGDPALSDPATLAASSDFGLMESYGDFLASDEQTASADGTGVAFVVQSQAVPQPGLANLMLNPSLEGSHIPWSPIDSVIGIAGPPNTVTGTHALSFIPTGTDPAGVEVHRQLHAIPVTPGQSYWLTCHLIGDPVGGPGGAYQLSVSYLDALRAQSLPGVVGDEVVVDSSPQFMFLYTGAAPDGAAFAIPRIVRLDPPGEEDEIVDDFMLYAGGPGFGYPGYFDGDKAFDGSYSYHWTADRYDSPSVRLPHVTTPIPADPTSPLDATLIVQSLIGDDVQVGDTFTFPADDVSGVGDDGQWYVDTSGKALYGPKDDGVWPDDPVILSA